MKPDEYILLFCRNIRFLRQKYRLSLESMAMLLEIRQEAMEQMEKGNLLPEVEVSALLRASQVFSLSPSTILETDLSQGEGYKPCT